METNGKERIHHNNRGLLIAKEENKENLFPTNTGSSKTI